MKIEFRNSMFQITIFGAVVGDYYLCTNSNYIVKFFYNWHYVMIQVVCVELGYKALLFRNEFKIFKLNEPHDVWHVVFEEIDNLCAPESDELNNFFYVCLEFYKPCFELTRTKELQWKDYDVMSKFVNKAYERIKKLAFMKKMAQMILNAI